MITALPTAPSAYGLKGPSAAVTVDNATPQGSTYLRGKTVQTNGASSLMHHSDRGSQYASHAFQDKLRAYGMICSMSRKGNCWDNAPTESWFNSFKNEWVHGIRYASHADMKATSFEYIEVFYNRKRQHSTLGYQSPIQFLENWLSEQHQQKLVA